MKSQNRYPICISLLVLWALLGAGFYMWGNAQSYQQSLQVLLLALFGLIGFIPIAWALGKLPQVMILYLGGILACAAAESSLYLLGHQRTGYGVLFRFDEKLGWRFIPNCEAEVTTRDYSNRVRINSEGFRDKNHNDSDPDRVVAILGDSFTSNLGVRFEEVFSTLLDKRLPKVSVKNFGVDGYGQVQELLLLEELLENHQPELVLLLVYVQNDFDDNLGEFDWARGYKRPRCRFDSSNQLHIDTHVVKPKPLGQLEQYHELFKSMRLYGLLKNAYHQSHRDLKSIPLHAQPPELRYCRKQTGTLEARAIKITKRLIENMRDQCADNQARFAVVITPSIWQVDPDRWSDLLEYHRLDPDDFDRLGPQHEIAQFCDGAQIPYLDLLPVLENHAKAGESLYNPHDQHWTAQGNLRVADALTQWLTTMLQ